MKHIYPILLVLFIILLGSCAKEKDFIYFQSNNTKNTVNTDSTIKQFVPVLKRNDVITITVSALDPEATKPFNLVAGNVPSYLIDEEGNIDFPVLGLIKLAGLSKTEAILLLTERIKSYVKNPIVTLKIINFKVTVLGDVSRPGNVAVPNERITLLEVLGQVGDLQLSGNRKNVLVISENEGVRTETRIDLTTKEIFNSPAYYLNQNDVVYVEVGKMKIKSTSDVVRYSGLVISISGFALALFNFFNK